MPLRLGFFALLPLALLAQPSLTVGIIGDQTGTANLDEAHAVLARAVARLRAERPQVVLHTGDLLESAELPDAYRARFRHAAGLLDGLDVPWHLAPGDHDVNPPAYRVASADRSREALWRELYQAREPRLQAGLWHSFNVGAYHFVALNSHETLHADPRWGSTFLARLSLSQREWLAADLRTHARARATVVFLHQPLWYQWADWQPVHDLLRRHRVAAVVAGHFHYDQDDGDLDGIRYLIVGAAGGSVKRASRDAGSAHHVTLLHLQGRQVKVTLLPLDGGPPLAATPRADMDRVQALDVMAGELYQFATQNPLCHRDGALFTGTTAATPARLRLIPIGNPLDVPLRVEVSLDSAQFRLDRPTFATGPCTTPGTCELPAATRIQLANVSSVVLASDAEPLWEATPALAGPPGDGLLRLRVRLSFTGVQDRHTVEGIAQTTVRECR